MVEILELKCTNYEIKGCQRERNDRDGQFSSSRTEVVRWRQSDVAISISLNVYVPCLRRISYGVCHWLFLNCAEEGNGNGSLTRFFPKSMEETRSTSPAMKMAAVWLRLRTA